MKTIQLTITRNFRTHSDDVYLKETRERIVDLEDGEDAAEVEQIVLQDMIASFKKAYPHLRTNINFDEVIQVKETSPINYVGVRMKIPPEPPNHSNQELIAMQDETEKMYSTQNIYQPKKTKSGTIEEHNNYHSPDIESIKKEIKSYKFGAKALTAIYGEMVKDSPELKKVFDEKVEELEQKNQTV